jgi:hypothetical protein
MTLVEVIEGLRAEGYDGSFLVDEAGSVRCQTCGDVVAAQAVVLDGIRRLEGESDPGDMAAVLAVRCTACDRRGAIVARYGPEAGPGDAALLLAIEDHRGPGLDVADEASRVEPSAPGPAGPPVAD